MGTGYEWMEPTNLEPMRKKTGSYLTSQVGQPLAPYPGDLTPSVPSIFGDIGSVYEHLLSGLGAPQITEEGTPMPRGGVPGSPMTWGTGTLRELMTTGLPSLTGPQKEAYRKEMELDLEKTIAGQMERRHLTGGRYSSGAQREVGRSTGEALTRYGSFVADLDTRMREAAANRRLAATGMAPTFEGAMYSIPLGVAGAATEFGKTQYGMEAGGLGAKYQEWLRQQPQYNPMLPQALQFLAQSPGAFVEDPLLSIFSSILGAGGNIAASAAGRPTSYG